METPSQSQPHPPRDLQPLRQRAHPGVDGETFLLQRLTSRVQLPQRHHEHLDELVLFELRFRSLVFRPRHVNLDGDHAEVRVAESGVWTGKPLS